MSWMSRSATSGGSRGSLTLPGCLEQGLNFFERVDRWQRALVSPLSLLSLLSPADHLHRADPQSGCPSAVCRVVVGEQGGLRVHAELVQRDLVDLSRRLGHPDLVGDHPSPLTSRIWSVGSWTDHVFDPGSSKA